MMMFRNPMFRLEIMVVVEAAVEEEQVAIGALHHLNLVLLVHRLLMLQRVQKMLGSQEPIIVVVEGEAIGDSIHTLGVKADFLTGDGVFCSV